MDPERVHSAIALAAAVAGFPRGAFDPLEWAVAPSEREHYAKLFGILNLGNPSVPGPCWVRPWTALPAVLTCATGRRAGRPLHRTPRRRDHSRVFAPKQAHRPDPERYLVRDGAVRRRAPGHAEPQAPRRCGRGRLAQCHRVCRGHAPRVQLPERTRAASSSARGTRAAAAGLLGRATARVCVCVCVCILPRTADAKPEMSLRFRSARRGAAAAPPPAIRTVAAHAICATATARHPGVRRTRRTRCDRGPLRRRTASIRAAPRDPRPSDPSVRPYASRLHVAHGA